MNFNFTFHESISFDYSNKAREAFHKELNKQVKQPQQLKLFPFPTDICRTTFCKPISKKDLGPASESRDQVIETSWGRIVFHSPDCGILEEDFKIIARKLWVKNGRKKFYSKYSDIMDELGYKRSCKSGKHQFSNYKLLKIVLERLQKTSFKIDIKKNVKGNTSLYLFVIKSLYEA